ncbi:MAG: hypothetical protein HY738_13225 [Bacteroidia bacterium]|nr:hypothetical protein [Bacteroidia bacterium]
MKKGDIRQNPDLKKLQYHTAEHRIICEKCGNDSFRVYIKIIIDDAEIICAKCGERYM